MANAMMVRLHNWLANLRDREEGQGLVEYVVLISLILVLILAAFTFFEEDITQQFKDIGNAITDIDP